MNAGRDIKIKGLAEKTAGPDGSFYRRISVKNVADLATLFQSGRREIERRALALGIWPERYARNSQTLTAKDQETLLDATVALVGLGGLGGIAADTLARLGIGTLILVDGDLFEDSNLNRQLLATTEELGRPKARAAARRIAVVNPSVTVHPHETFLSAENAKTMLQQADLVMDCLDTIPARLALERAASDIGIPVVSGAVAGLSGQVTVIYPEDAGLAALYGDGDAIPERGVETTLGNLAHPVNIVASLQCSEALKVLLRRPGQLRNRLLLMDLSDNSFDIIDTA